MRSRQSRSTSLRSRCAPTRWLSRDSWILDSRSERLIAAVNRLRRRPASAPSPGDMDLILYVSRIVWYPEDRVLRKGTRTDGRLTMILVTGATGNVGREAVNLLLAEGEKAAAVTRNPATAALPGGAHVVGGDPSRPKTLTSALRGVEAILLSPRAVGDATAELLSLAAEQGVERVVLLSAATVEHT